MAISTNMAVFWQFTDVSEVFAGPFIRTSETSVKTYQNTRRKCAEAPVVAWLKTLGLLSSKFPGGTEEDHE